MRFGRLPLHDRADFVLARTTGRRVVSVGLGGQVGATDYSFDLAAADLVHTFSARLAAAAAQVTFVDISARAIEAFSPHVEADYVEADVTADPSEWPSTLLETRCDVVVLGEVLEHLDAPGRALRGLQQLLAPGGVIVITVPNAFNLSVIAKIAVRNENVHPEHVAYYSPSTLTRLCESASLTICELAFYRTRPLRASQLLHAPLGYLSGAVAERLPQFARGLVAVARPESTPAARGV